MRAVLGVAAVVAAASVGGPVLPARANEADDTTFALTRSVDPNGLTLLRKNRLRSPSGFLYPYPWTAPSVPTSVEGWTLRGLAELGWAQSWGGDDEAYFDRYTDESDGPIDWMRLEAHRPRSGDYVEVGAQALGRDDVSASIDLGRRGLFRLRGYWDQLPHRYAEDARVLFRGAGTERLTLPPPLLPGANSDAAIDAALATTGTSRVAITREQSGVELSLDPSREVGLRAGYRRVARRGERPFGGAIRFAYPSPGAGSVVETLEPIDSRTHDFHGDLALTVRHVQAELGYEGSIFENRHASLTWDNPFPETGVDQGRFALSPDNILHRLHATVSFPIPGRGRWTHTASWSSARQNERLLAPTLNPSFPDWTDPSSSLTRETAHARVDTTLLTSTLRLAPLRRLSLGARVRYKRRDDRTRYVALNPSTGNYGYVIEDGSFGIRPRYAAVPFDLALLDVSGNATWRIRSDTQLSVEYEHERTEREQRARSVTRDDRGRISLSTRRIPRTTVRLSYEISTRSGSAFRYDRDATFYSAGPPDFAEPPIGTPQRSLVGFQQFDLADRLEHRVSGRVSFELGEIADLAFAGGVRDDDYDSRYGLRGARSIDANVELDLQPSPAIDAYVYGSAEWRRWRLATITAAAPTGSDLQPGGPVFPLQNAWTVRSCTRTISAGAGITARPIRRLELRADYQLLASNEGLAYAFASESALAPGVTAQDAGNGFPDLRNLDHLLDASARITVTDWLSTRILYRFQDSHVANFQQTGLSPRIGHALYLGHVDGDFTAHVLGATVEVRF